MKGSRVKLIIFFLLFTFNYTCGYSEPWGTPRAGYKRPVRPKRKKAKKRKIPRPKYKKKRSVGRSNVRKKSTSTTKTKSKSESESIYSIYFITDDSSGISRSPYWGVSSSIADHGSQVNAEDSNIQGDYNE